MKYKFIFHSTLFSASPSWLLKPSLEYTIGPLHDPVTWYGINYTGTQITQWDFQNKGKSDWTGASSFVLEVPLRNLRPSVIYSVPCDRIVQRAYRRSLFVGQLRFSVNGVFFVFLEN